MNCGKAVIDHHRTQDDLGAIRFVDTNAEAAGRLVYEATVALGVPITAEAANGMFLALATDTGWFRHSSVEPRAFDLAEELVRAGAKPTVLYDAVYGNSTLARMRLVGKALERMKSEANGQIVYTEVHWSDYTETGAVPPDTEDLINYPRSVNGVEIALVFIEQRDGSTKVSFRGKENQDVGRLAEQFGGGGHRMASGATVLKPIAETRSAVLTAAKAALS
jgi:phosphoesterase RecJ-like protein